jgi:glyoxylase I family protein
MSLEIIGRPAGESRVNQRWVGHVACWVDDFPASFAALKGRGIGFETDTLVDIETIRTALFRDPEGNHCQIVWRGRPLGA